MRFFSTELTSPASLRFGSTDVADLTQRVARGEPAAVGQVYDLHHQAVRGFARRLLGDPVGAEDLVHDVFLALPQALAGYRGDAPLRTFLLGVTVNHARHYVRAAARRRAAVGRFAEVDAQQAPSPEHEARRRELAAALQRALDQLPLDQRVAFVLCEVEERTSREVAEIVGAPEGTVRTRLHHAKRRLREALDREGLR
jgi:RNA polymerase sigma-70 factor (ECF subfamily)